MVLLKWMHGPMEKDEVCLHGYLSRLVCDEMDVMFLRTCVLKNIRLIARAFTRVI